MKRITWSPPKAAALKLDKSRGGVGFEECVIAIEEGRVLADVPHPGEGYSHQRLFVLEIHDYAYVVPYVEDENGIFLKTVFPSRRMTALFLRRNDDES